MIDYWKKKIEFEVYDYPFESTKLYDYYVGKVRVLHKKNKITIISLKKEIIPAVGIFFHKWENMDEDYKDFVETTVKNDIRIDMSVGIEKIIENCIKLDQEEYTLEISCDCYDMTKEKGIICYYNTNENYNNELLQNIIKDPHY